MRLPHELPLLFGLALVVGGVSLYALRLQLLSARTAMAALTALALLLGAGLLGPRSVRIPIEPFGVFLTLGLGAGLAVAAASAARAGLDRRLGGAALLGAQVGALLGARVLYLLAERVEGGAMAWLALGRGGLSGYGAAFGAWLGALFVLRRAETPAPRTRAWLDAAAPAFLFTFAIARIGCYLAGCDFGRPLRAAAPVWLARLGRFPAPTTGNPSPAFSAHALAGELAPGGQSTPPLHPVQLYEALAALLLLALLLALRPRQRRHGDWFALATLGFALLRYFGEMARGDADRGLLGRFSVTELSAIASGLAALFWWRSRVRATPADA